MPQNKRPNPHRGSSAFENTPRSPARWHPHLRLLNAGCSALWERQVAASMAIRNQFVDNCSPSEVARPDEEVNGRMAPFEEALWRVQEIPGIGRRVAQEVIAETGTDMTRFPTAAHLASWARVCPSNNESAGKRKAGRTGHGNRWLRSALVRGGLGGRPDSGDVPGSAIPPADRSPWCEARRRRPFSYHPGHRLPPAAYLHLLPEPRPRLLRETQRAGARAKGSSSHRAARLQGNRGCPHDPIFETIVHVGFHRHHRV